jgi:hypothetical protein
MVRAGSTQEASHRVVLEGKMEGPTVWMLNVPQRLMTLVPRVAPLGVGRALGTRALWQVSRSLGVSPREVRAWPDPHTPGFQP